MLNVAIVGCGQVSDAHIGEIQKLANARVCAVCDRELLMAERLAVRYGVSRYYDDFHALLARERPDVVHIATPPASHLALAKQALDAGAHIYVEKPFALDYRDALGIIEHAQSAGRKVTIGHTYELDPPAREARRLLSEGVLGEPVHVESWFGYDLDGSFGKAILGDRDHWVHRLPGKLFQNNINHMLNKITELVDDEEPVIHAMAWKRRRETFGDVRDELCDELRVSIQGETCSAYGTFTSHVQPDMHYCRIYGTKNIVDVNYDTRTVSLVRGPTLPSAIGRLLPGYAQALEFLRAASHNTLAFAKSEFHLFAGLNELIRRFYDAVENDAPPPIAYRDILRISRWMDEIFRQIATRGEASHG